MSLPAKLTKWLVFSVLLALLPIGYNYLRVLTRGGDPTVENLLGKGELLLVTAGISAAALGNLIGSGKDWLRAKMFAGGGSVIMLILVTLYFTDITSTPAGQSLNSSVIASYSKWFFLFSVLAGAGCVALEEL